MENNVAAVPANGGVRDERMDGFVGQKEAEAANLVEVSLVGSGSRSVCDRHDAALRDGARAV